MEKPTTLLESPARVALVRQVGIISLSLAAILSVSSCADNGPIGCRGVDVQTTGTPWVGFDFDYRLPDGEAFETASLNFGDGPRICTTLCSRRGDRYY